MAYLCDRPEGVVDVQVGLGLAVRLVVADQVGGANFPPILVEARPPALGADGHVFQVGDGTVADAPVPEPPHVQVLPDAARDAFLADRVISRLSTVWPRLPSRG